MSHQNDCARTTLAEGPAGRIRRCQCGTIHVDLKLLSFRVEERSFEHLCHLLWRAHEALVRARLRERRAATEIPVVRWSEGEA